MPPDSTDTRRRLLDAATAEFAAHGLAGARVVSIAGQAGANKRLIYAYYGNKEELFDTVVARAIAELADAVPFTVDDLPGYAGGLFDHMVASPRLLRLSMWKLLERPAATLDETAAYRPKAEAVRAAQAAGTLPPGDPANLLILVIGLAAAWFTASPALHGLATDRGPDSPDRLGEYRAAVVAAVTAAIRPR